MKLLFDSHTFVWWIQSPALISPAALAACSDPANQILLSVASVWELQIKVQIGKLQFLPSIAHHVQIEQQRNFLQLLNITADHVFALNSLPLHHRDPFDRMLVAQAVTASAAIVSKDPYVARYGVSTIW